MPTQEAGANPRRQRLCIITGLSGAGKSTALRAFEDLNFFAVDGLPAALFPEMAALMSRPSMSHYCGMAICMDLRERDFLDSFNKSLLELSGRGLEVSLLFLEASELELLKRYASTRRPHPLEKQGLHLTDAINQEKEQLAPMREMADLILDSTGYSIHDLRRAIHGRYGALSNSAHKLSIHVLSFGFKYGVPQDADFVFDLRFLPNPYFVESLKKLSGLDHGVAEFVLKNSSVAGVLERLEVFFDFTLPLIESEGRYRTTIAFGCTGGRHRSVAIAQALADYLEKNGYFVTREHRNLASDIIREKNRRP